MTTAIPAELDDSGSPFGEPAVPAPAATPSGPRQCTSKSKQSGVRCRKPVKPGLDVCYIHGGSTKKAKAKSQRAVQSAKATAIAQRIGLKIDVQPQQALLDEVQRSAGMVAFYEEQVNAVVGIDPDRLSRGVTRIEEMQSKFPVTTTTTEASVHIWLQLYNEERDRLVRVAATAIRAGIEERRVELAEQQGQAFVSVIRNILNRLALSPDQQALVSTVVPEELRALAAA